MYNTLGIDYRSLLFAITSFIFFLLFFYSLKHILSIHCNININTWLLTNKVKTFHNYIAISNIQFERFYRGKKSVFFLFFFAAISVLWIYSCLLLNTRKTWFLWLYKNTLWHYNRSRSIPNSLYFFFAVRIEKAPFYFYIFS